MAAGRHEVAKAGERIEELLAQIRASADPALGEGVDELVHRLVDLYGAGLERIVAILTEAPSLGESRQSLLADPLVSALFVLHGLHPSDARTRVEQALDKVRPYLGAHAGSVSLLGIAEGGVVELELGGSCDGCSSSAATVTNMIERAIFEAAPELTRVEVRTASGAAHATHDPPTDLIQLGRRAPAPTPAGSPP